MLNCCEALCFFKSTKVPYPKKGEKAILRKHANERSKGEEGGGGSEISALKGFVGKG